MDGSSLQILYWGNWLGAANKWTNTIFYKTDLGENKLHMAFIPTWVQQYKALDRNNHVYGPVRQIIKSNHTFYSVFNLSLILIFIYFRFSRIDTKIQREAVFWSINIFQYEIWNHLWQKLSLLNKNQALGSIITYL